MSNQITESKMTAQEARECIDQINDNLKDTRDLLLELYERKGWSVLGYDSWRSCVTGEFKEKERYLYYQLAAAKTEQNLCTLVQKDEEIPETHLRPLASLPADQQREVYQKAVETAPEGKVTAKHIEETVREMTEENEVVKEPPEPPKPSPVMIAEDFLSAYAEMRKQIVKAQNDKWTTTTRTEAVKFIGRLLEMVTREGDEK